LKKGTFYKEVLSTESGSRFEDNTSITSSWVSEPNQIMAHIIERISFHNYATPLKSNELNPG
jgi:hypothetical protein